MLSVAAPYGTGGTCPPPSVLQDQFFNFFQFKEKKMEEVGDI